jgi:hypothetical protein
MRNVAAAAKLADRGREWRVIFAYPQPFEFTTGAMIALVKNKLAAEHQHRILTLDYLKLTEELLRSGDAIASGLGKHMAARLLR